jgi:hypothetical protein
VRERGREVTSLYEHAGGEEALHRLEQNSWAETDADLHPIRNVPRWEWSDERRHT